MSRRAFAKETSNVGLGKFSQSDFKDKHKYIYSFQEYTNKRFFDSTVKVKNLTPLNDRIAELTFEPDDEMIGYHRNTQVVVYSFVTAFARIGMMRDMRELLKLGARLFYTDTDSIIFDYPKNKDKKQLEKQFSMGSKAYNAYKYETSAPIKSFVTLGAKNYSYVTHSGETSVKVRGFTLESKTAKGDINHEVMKDLLDKFVHKQIESTYTNTFRMKIDRKTQTVKNSTIKKKYSNNVFDKRNVIAPETKNNSTYLTLPFGLVHEDFADISR